MEGFVLPSPSAILYDASLVYYRSAKHSYGMYIFLYKIGGIGATFRRNSPFFSCII